MRVDELHYDEKEEPTKKRKTPLRDATNKKRKNASADIFKAKARKQYVVTL